MICTVPVASTTLVAVCRKCGKKLGGGFCDKGRTPLAKALRKYLKLPKWKRSPVRIVETGCMKLCPKGAVAVATSGDVGQVYVVPAGTAVVEVAQCAATFGQPCGRRACSRKRVTSAAKRCGRSPMMKCALSSICFRVT